TCASSSVVNSYAVAPPVCKEYTFYSYNGELHVPSGAMAAYFLAPVWQNFTNLKADLTDKVTLEETEVQMLKGEELQLSATTIPETAALTWGTTDPSVAVVDISGKVTATGVGECDIYASLVNNLAVYTTCHIDAHSSAAITLPIDFLTIRPNTIATLTPMFDPEPVNIVATSSDPSVAIARVVKKNNSSTRALVASDKQVQVLGITQGTATITVASTDGQSVPATCEITVVALEPTDSITHDKHNPAEYISGTLPVLYVNTEGEKEIISKDEYLEGSYYLDTHGLEGYENIGSAEAPLALQIKGRGNFTWGYDKKPYRLKFDKKASPLGMKKSKHFVLLANCEEGPLSLYKDVLGLWLGKQLGLDWTPDIKPVELVINGDYRGLYNLAEQVRVDPDRVNVVEQDDGETDPELVTGGWLVEIDNYDAPAYASGDGGQVINTTNTGGGHDEGTTQTTNSQVVMRTRADGSLMRFTPKTPEVLSEVQRAYLIDLVLAVDSLINVEDKDNRAWEELIDLDALARYYLVNEVMYDVEAFNANCYWHKERGDDAKMVFGPVWDFGAAADEWTPEQESFLYNNEYMMPFRPNHWIGEIAKFPRFQQRVKAHWSHYVNDVHPEMASKLVQHYQTVATAATDGDYRRWPQYNGNGALSAARSVLQQVEQHYNWLITQWGHGYPGDVNGDDVVNGADVTALYNVLLNDAPAAGNADVNNDGIVNGADVTALYNLLLN
ncbi:MAG: CotH kinase family protein, partial [Muribaculaceae bacterium]|nr:CotH kinase family protein [Muribaculaceae bacterium]